ncbi:M1 family peptidase, partial [Candidatus Roizmanbacteria bacterium]|nr:M1 family peptidase [Candidatus Roizmanbacteria bacterium]
MTIKPINYELTFSPDLKRFIFSGSEKIIFNLEHAVKEVVLDTVDLKIHKVELLFQEKNVVSSFKLDRKSEKLIVRFSKVLQSGKYELSIDFQGVLNDHLNGFYRSKYEVDGKIKYLATTQFEAADARRAFPCIDHPSYKAAFDISLIVDAHLTAVSNGLVEREEKLAKNKKKVTFERTPKMSTYLLYLGAGEFESIENRYGTILLRVLTT